MMRYLLTIILTVIVFTVAGCGDRAIPGGPVDAVLTLTPQTTPTPVINVSLLSKNFDDEILGNTPNAWVRSAIFTSVDVYMPVSNTAYVSYNKAVNLRTFTGTPERQIIKAPLTTVIPDIAQGTILISFFVRKNETNKGKGFVFYINQAEKLRIDFNEAGNITYYTAKSNYTAVSTYAANTWYKVDLKLNLTNDNYDLYINNISLVTAVPCYNSTETSLAGTAISAGSAVYTTFFGILTNINTAYMQDNTYIDSLTITYN